MRAPSWPRLPHLVLRAATRSAAPRVCRILAARSAVWPREARSAARSAAGKKDRGSAGHEAYLEPKWLR
jgi:hypothetical protein